MDSILSDIISVVVAMMLTLIVKKVADWRTDQIDDDYEIEEKSNFAVGARRAGLYLGGMIIMSTVFIGSSNGILNDVIDLIVYGILGYILLFIARGIVDIIVLKSIDNDNACKNGNCAVGIVEFGNYLASALIIAGSIIGDSNPILAGGLKNTLNDILNVVAFFAIGQIVLIVSIKLYEIFTPYKWIEEIKQGNASAGIMSAGISIALGILLKKSIAGPFVSWSADLISFALNALIGIVALFILIPLVDKLFLPHTTINIEIKRDKNISVVLVASCLNIGFAMLIASLL
ncbi:MAG: DUF350 domain-containing protein [Candidatus Cloacimonetes bacterium]|nr:DUF350 domain-containing protein [Candidatus Cloacimonadota bacterium]